LFLRKKMPGVERKKTQARISTRGKERGEKGGRHGKVSDIVSYRDRREEEERDPDNSDKRGATPYRSRGRKKKGNGGTGSVFLIYRVRKGGRKRGERIAMWQLAAVAEEYKKRQHNSGRRGSLFLYLAANVKGQKGGKKRKKL